MKMHVWNICLNKVMIHNITLAFSTLIERMLICEIISTNKKQTKIMILGNWFIIMTKRFTLCMPMIFKKI